MDETIKDAGRRYQEAATKWCRDNRARFDSHMRLDGVAADDARGFTKARTH